MNILKLVEFFDEVISVLTDWVIVWKTHLSYLLNIILEYIPWPELVNQTMWFILIRVIRVMYNICDHGQLNLS